MIPPGCGVAGTREGIGPEMMAEEVDGLVRK
jgi:hypothetical protein